MDLTRISKKLSYLLRHCTNPRLIDLDGGWADVDAVLRVLKRSYPDVDRNVLEEIVRSDEKGRYAFSSDGRRIRACQGHSIPNVVIVLEKREPPELLYHGTSTRSLDGIFRDGLKPMSRQYVHISQDFETAVKVGKRHGNPVVLIVDAKRFVDDGHELFVSTNGVWLARAVPIEYLTVQYL